MNNCMIKKKPNIKYMMHTSMQVLQLLLIYMNTWEMNSTGPKAVCKDVHADIASITQPFLDTRWALCPSSWQSNEAHK